MVPLKGPGGRPGKMSSIRVRLTRLWNRGSDGKCNFFVGMKSGGPMEGDYYGEVCRNEEE